MVYQTRHILTESEKNRIRGLYGINPVNDHIITEWLSPDEKYVIFLDELYDIKNKIKIGDIWENIENFKFFIKHSFEVSKDVPNEIKESVENSLNNLILVESNKNYSGLKTQIKDYIINEGIGDWINGAGEWLKDTATNAVEKTGEFFSKSFEGVKKIVNGITSGEWAEVINLLKKGGLWVARKIRSALYNPVGLILDAILVASGVGKGFQVIVWGIVVGLDIYELISGNYENNDENFLMRLLFTGIDIIGLILAGSAAKSLRTMVSGVFKKFGTTIEGLSKAAKSNSTFRNVLEKMMTSAKTASTKMGEVAKFLQKKSPMLYNFISKILGSIGKFAQKIIDIVSSILGVGKKIISAPGKGIEKVFGTGKLGKGTKAGVETTGIVGGIGTFEKVKEIEKNRQINNMFANSKPIFDGV